MKFTRHLKPKQKKALELEVISTDLKVHLTRLLERHITTDRDGDIIRDGNFIVHQNDFINQSRNIQGLPIYTLEDVGYGYEPGEYAWHNADFQLIFRRLSTIEFVEFLGDLIESEVFTRKTINDLLKVENASFRFTYEDRVLGIEILELKEIEALMTKLDSSGGESVHVNIPVLIARAEDAIPKDDFAQVIHSCASVYETLAKDVIADSKIDDQTLGSFFDKYRKTSGLPTPILDFILAQYKLRGSMPLAGHGSRNPPPPISKEEAVLLIEMTKAFVKTEYKLLSSMTTTVHPISSRKSGTP